MGTHIVVPTIDARESLQRLVGDSATVLIVGQAFGAPQIDHLIIMGDPFLRARGADGMSAALYNSIALWIGAIKMRSAKVTLLAG